MQYRTRNNSVTWIIGGIIACVVVVLFFLFRAPLITLFSSARTTSFSFDSRTNLRNQIAELTEKNIYTTALEAEVATLTAENAALRNITSTGISGLRARVVGRVDRSLFDRVFIDQGSREGVSVGDRISAGGAIIGHVSQVLDHQSLVTYVSDPGVETDAILIIASVPVRFVGRGGGSVAFELPRDVAIQEGDVLAVASDPSHPIAIVESFSTDDRNPVRTVEARLPVNIHQLHYVLIVR